MAVYLFYRFMTKKDSEFLEKEMQQFPDEIRENINCYQNENDRNLRIISKILLVKAFVELFPFEKNILKRIKKTSENQPYIDGFNLNFSVSHTEKFCAVAVAEKGKIGMDAEMIKPISINDFDDFLHPAEKKFLSKKENPEKEFLNIWTKKEAVLKATGKAISDELNQIDAHLETTIFNDEKFYFKAIKISEEYIINITTNFENSTPILKKIEFF